MKKAFVLLLLIAFSKIATAQLNYGNETFSYNGFTVSHYGLWWYADPAASAYGPMAYFTAYGGIQFFTEGTPRAVLDVNGNLGIGTLTPAYKLDVAGDVSFGVANSDVNIFFKGYNSAYSRIFSNAGASSNYNGLTLTSNFTAAIACLRGRLTSVGQTTLIIRTATPILSDV